MAECPKEALRDATIPPMARILLTVLWAYAGRGKRFVFPSVPTLSAETGMSERACRRNLSRLRDLGWIAPATAEAGRPGWHLCDPPGVPAHTGHEGPTGAPHPDATVIEDENPRTPASEPADAGVIKADASVTKADASVRTPASARTLASSKADASVHRLSIGTNHEPQQQQRGSTVQPAGEPAASSSSSSSSSSSRGQVDPNAWRLEVLLPRWAPLYAGSTPESGVHLPDPTSGAHRWSGLQAALDAHGSEVVLEVVLHAGREMARHHETKGRHGLEPRKLSALFVSGKEGAWAALLDSWQREAGRRRSSGRISAAPPTVDGRPLSDEEHRAYMRAGGGREGTWAVQELRAKEQAGEFDSAVARFVDNLEVPASLRSAVKAYQAVQTEDGES